MKELSIDRMEMVSGGVNWSCVGAVAGGIGLLAWSFGVPVVGPLTALVVLGGIGTTLGTVAMVAQCNGY